MSRQRVRYVNFDRFMETADGNTVPIFKRTEEHLTRDELKARDVLLHSIKGGRK